jgi:hypothetical protein
VLTSHPAAARIGPSKIKMADDAGAKVYADAVKEVLEGEERWRASVESRGHTVITGSGALVTLLFGLAALLTKATAYVPSVPVRVLLVIALVLFALAALAAIGTQMPLPAAVVDVEKVMAYHENRWQDPERVAQCNVTRTRVDSLAIVQSHIQLKAVLLATAVSLQVGAVVVLAAGVGVVLLGG